MDTVPKIIYVISRLSARISGASRSEREREREREREEKGNEGETYKLYNIIKLLLILGPFGRMN
jgi:hypothetical protein